MFVYVWIKVYHSSFVDDEGINRACGCPLLPLKSHIKGPAPVSDQGFPFPFQFIVFCFLRFSECEICILFVVNGR